MATVLCPTRGGEASFPNQDRAIAIAKEHGLDILFLYVSDVQFLNMIASPVLIDIHKELDRMGEFMLAMAQERAEKGGVQAKSAIRRGVFRQALQDVIQEHTIAAIVLGSAVGQTAVTTPDYMQNLVQWILAETGIQVYRVDQGEIIEHHTP